MTTWHGWLWMRGRWEKVCEAAGDLDACARRLGQIGDARNVPTRHQVMTGGAMPTFEPSRPNSHGNGPRRPVGERVGPAAELDPP